MPLFVPEVLPRATCELCDATSTAVQGDDSEEFFPTEEGWIIAAVSEVLPNPDREQEATMREEYKEKTGEEIAGEWNTAPLVADTRYCVGCPKHSARIKSLLGMDGEL